VYLFLLKRLLALVPVLLGVAVVTFILVLLIPGDPVDVLLGDGATPQARAIYRKELHLDGRVDQRFVAWIEHALRGDLGTSISSGRPASQVALTALGNTAQLGFAVILIALFVGVTTGIAMGWSANRIGRLFNVLVAGAMSIPSFWLGLILLYLFSLKLHLFPSGGIVSFTGKADFVTRVRHIVLPAVTVALLPTALIARLSRTLVLELRRQDFVLTLQTRGFSTVRILRHLLRNASPGIVNIAGLQAGYVVLGALFAEVVFSWPGIGTQIVSAVQSRDYPVIQAIVLITGAIFSTITVIVDTTMRTLDPRLETN
jgi:peptide/nickel transport system permease protein